MIQLEACRLLHQHIWRWLCGPICATYMQTWQQAYASAAAQQKNYVTQLGCDRGQCS